MTKNTNTIDIFNAVRNDDIETVKTYINNGGDVNVKNKYGVTALVLARRTVEIAKLLLDAGADVNAKNKWGETPLMWARDAEIAKLLIDAGADVNARDDHGFTALMWACSNVEIKKLLKSHGAVA